MKAVSVDGKPPRTKTNLSVDNFITGKNFPDMGGFSEELFSEAIQELLSPIEDAFFEEFPEIYRYLFSRWSIHLRLDLLGLTTQPLIKFVKNLE